MNGIKAPSLTMRLNGLPVNRRPKMVKTGPILENVDKSDTIDLPLTFFRGRVRLLELYGGAEELPKIW